MSYESGYDAVLDTREKAIRYVRGCIQEAPGEFNVDAIVDELYSLAQDWDVSTVEQFWSVVERHKK